MKALRMFQSDYNRWYSGEINEEKLNMTPQFQAVLLYCIANNVCKIGADSFSLLGRHIGQIEIYYSTDIGPGFKINHGVGSVIGARAKISAYIARTLADTSVPEQQNSRTSSPTTTLAVNFCLTTRKYSQSP